MEIELKKGLEPLQLIQRHYFRSTNLRQGRRHPRSPDRSKRKNLRPLPGITA